MIIINKNLKNKLLEFFSGTILRVLSIISRFVLVLILLNKLSLYEFGQFGLITVSATYLIYLFGFEFHNYTSKELLKHKIQKWGFIFINRIYFSIITFSILLFLLIFLNKYFLINLNNIYLIFFIIFFEHILTESNRVFYIKGDYITYVWLDFLRKSLLPIIILAIYLVDYKINLDLILNVWFFSLMFSFITSFYFLNKIKFKISKKDYFINIKFLIKGVKKSTFLLISLLIGNLVFIVDRYFLNFLYDEIILSSYIFFIAISLLPLSITDSAVITRYFRVLLLNSKKNIIKFKLNFLEALKVTIFIILSFDILCFFTIEKLIVITGKEILLDNMYIFYFLIIIGNVICINKLFDLCLYSLGKNFNILKSNILLVVSFLITMMLTSIYNNVISVFLYGFLFSALISLIYKTKNILKNIN
jgi:O-antigen/teichoic acid export membrane protein